MSEEIKERNITIKEWTTPDSLLLIKKWTRDGLTVAQIAKRMGIALSTFYNWRNKSMDIVDSLKKGREIVDTEVENSLLKKAMGYTIEEKTQELDAEGNVYAQKITTKYMPPDTASIIFWLTNRLPEIWRNKRDNNVSFSGGDAEINIKKNAD